MISAVVSRDDFAGTRMWALRADGKAYGSFADLEAVNQLLITGFGPGGFTVSGAALCDVAGEAGREGRPVCRLLASRTLLWTSPARAGIHLTCAADLAGFQRLVPAGAAPQVLLFPVGRGGHGSLFRLAEPGDAMAFAALTGGVRELREGAVP